MSKVSKVVKGTVLVIGTVLLTCFSIRLFRKQGYSENALAE